MVDRSVAAGRILVVDDDEWVRFGLLDYFVARGFLVDGAAGVAEAEELFRRARHDVVITDLHLTGRGAEDGIDLITRLRTASPALRIFAMTAFASPEAERAARAAGAEAFFQKPTSLPDMERLITRGGAQGALAPRAPDR